MSLMPPLEAVPHQTLRRTTSNRKLVRRKSLTQSPYVNGILWGGKYWNLGNNKSIRYSFLNNRSANFDNSAFDETQNPNDWRSFEKAAVKQAFQAISQVANISFKQASDDTQEATLKLYNLSDQEADFDGSFGPPGERDQGFGYFNRGAAGWTQTQISPGSYAFNLLLHEIGHGLGLAHPHDDGGGSNTFPGVRPFFSLDLGRNNQNQGIYTVMSYIDGKASDQTQTTDPYGHATTLMPFDIAALQHLYGANTRYHQGNNHYRLPALNQPGTYYSTIWDTGGIDTIHAGNTKRNARINLQAAPLQGKQAGGYLSQHDAISGGLLIANQVDIENAVGGKGDDRIVGNELNNILDGQRGDDRLLGKAGHDRLLGQDGRDSLSGESGNDLLHGGIGRDTLSGGQGQDILVGGPGADLFRVEPDHGPDKIRDFSVQESDQIQLLGQQMSPRLKAGDLPKHYFTLGSQAPDRQTRLIYDRDQGALYFDADGLGGDRQTLLLTVKPGVNLSHRQFQVI